MPEYFSASKINRLMKQIKEELDIEVPTERHFIQQSYSTLIVSSGQNRGQVRTFAEAVEFRQRTARKFGQPYRPYTRQEYQADMRSLNRRIKGYQSVDDARQTYRENARQLIEEYNSYTDGSIDYLTIDFDILKQVIDRATEAMGKRDKDRSDSPKLFRLMHEYFEELGVRNAGNL